jgi:hypothetical protein
MTIKKSLEVSGNFLFKYRGHIPLIVFILVVLCYKAARKRGANILF